MRQASLQSRLRDILGRAAILLLAFAVCVSTAAEATAAPFAAIVVDASTGKTLYASSPDSRRYPASLTKMMTLYLTFDALKRGKIKKTTAVPFSVQAATQAPTKIGVKAGGAISVEQAVLSLITRSANDSAVALAELLGGSSDNFARMMTAKARALGMKNTVFRNPNGLPNTAQFTSARDMAILGIALREHFPQYYPYFSVRSFKFGRQRIANHNRLLGRIKGVDGIKTGYTRASGFNLVSSVSDGKRKIVAVVMGGASGASRDNQMAELIRIYLPKASGRGGGDLIAKGGDDRNLMEIASAMLPSRDAPTPDAKPEIERVVDEIGEGDTEEVATTDEYEVGSMGVKIDAPAEERFGGDAAAKAKSKKMPKAAETAKAAATPKAEARKAAVDPIETASTQPPKSGWSIQVGSSPSKSEAEEALQKAAAKGGKALASASAYTATFDKDGTTYYRARFGGFASQTAASKACGQLKKQKIACYATQ